MTPDEIAGLFLADIEPWYESKRDAKGNVNRNVMTVGLIMVDRMATAFPHDPDTYQTKRGSVRGLRGKQIGEILKRHGEMRPISVEGGGTSRGTPDLAVQLADLLSSSAGAMPYRTATADDQKQVRDLVQGWFVDRVRADFLDRRRIEADLDPGRPARQAVAELLRAARERGGNASGAVAQYLVGAKLSLRFPDLVISNESYTTADQQTARPGDFLVGDTAFHVTLSPTENLWANRCKENLRNGYRVLVLVPDELVLGASQIAGFYGVGDRVAVSGIESFVGTNIEEIAEFGAAEIRSGLRTLLERYNERVGQVEPDPSLQIEIPSNL